MRIREEFKKLGCFWLPSAPGGVLPGILSISDGGNIELEVIGGFDDKRMGPLFNALRKDPQSAEQIGGYIERIVGYIENDGPVTLDDCYFNGHLAQLQGPTYSLRKLSFLVERAFIRVEYGEGEIPRFNNFIFSVEGIDEWSGISNFRMLERDEKNTTMSYQVPTNTPLNLNNGMQLFITFPHTCSSIENRISYKTYFTLSSPNALELDEFISVAGKIRSFLCFAINEMIPFDSISAASDNLQAHMGKPLLIDIYDSRYLYFQDEPKINRGMLFKFEKIQSNPGLIINNWIEAYEKITPAFNLYFLAKMGEQQYLEERFMALVQGLEAYHRRTSNQKQMDEAEFKELIDNLIDQCPQERKEWLKGKLQYGNEVSLRHRLKSLIEPFKEIIEDQKKQKELINRIVNTRNYLTHYDQSLELEAAQGDALWNLCLKMELLFQLHFLKLIGFSREQIDSLLANSLPLRWKF